MKKLILALLLVLNLATLFSNGQRIQAAEEEFPYQGYYSTEENRFIQGFIFEEHAIYILLMAEQKINPETKNRERWENLINYHSYSGAMAIIEPSMDAEDIEKWREENMPNFAEIYTEVAKQITPDMTRGQIDAMIDAQVPSIDLSNAYLNSSDIFVAPYVKINAPTVRRSQSLWRIEINGNEILRFEYEENPDGSTITDDYGVTYTKQEGNPLEGRYYEISYP